MILRLASGIALAALAAPMVAVETAVDPSFGFAPLVLNGESREGGLEANVGVKSKYIDQGITLSNDVTAIGSLAARYYGVGLKATTGIALSSDSRDLWDTSFGDIVGANIKLDFLGEIEWADNVPLLTFNPYLEVVTYPVQPSTVGTWDNQLKSDQRWLGADLWLSPPIQGFEGFEVGGGVAYNIGDSLPMFRGAVGARYLRQFAEGFEIDTYGLANFGNRRYHQELSDPAELDDGHVQNLTTVAFGLDFLMPLPIKEWYVTFGGSVNIWANDRSDVEALGQNATETVLGIGLEWHPGE